MQIGTLLLVLCSVFFIVNGSNYILKKNKKDLNELKILEKRGFGGFFGGGFGSSERFRGSSERFRGSSERFNSFEG